MFGGRDGDGLRKVRWAFLFLWSLDRREGRGEDGGGDGIWLQCTNVKEGGGKRAGGGITVIVWKRKGQSVLC